MVRRRIGHHISGGGSPEDDAARDRDQEVRDALSRWVSGVSLVAVRDQGRIHALTVSAFMPLSLDPPTVVVSLGPNASAAPYLEPGTRFGISVLAAEQRRLASRYADTFPVGPSPFGQGDVPLVEDAVVGLTCIVEEILSRADHRLVIAGIQAVELGPDEPVLGYRKREYRTVE